jgi:predicted AAA+ superfamily ATPase
VNLLGGRAVTLSLEPFSFAELGIEFDLADALQWGLLPVVLAGADSEAPAVLDAYMGTYLREEIRAEGAVRSLPPFARFLSIAGQLNGQVLNIQNVARDAAVSRSTVDGYFDILQDTLLSHPLPAYRPGLKVRERSHPKFFWVDPGIARAAAGLLYEPADRTWLGAALETLVFHELRCFNTFGGRQRAISYYRTPAGSEIDFVVETRKRRSGSPPHVVCIEVKSNVKWSRKWERPMRDLADNPAIVVERMVGVYAGKDRYRFDGLDVLPVNAFLEELHAGRVF